MENMSDSKWQMALAKRWRQNIRRNISKWVTSWTLKQKAQRLSFCFFPPSLFLCTDSLSWAVSQSDLSNRHASPHPLYWCVPLVLDTRATHTHRRPQHWLTADHRPGVSGPTGLHESRVVAGGRRGKLEWEVWGSFGADLQEMQGKYLFLKSWLINRFCQSWWAKNCNNSSCEISERDLCFRLVKDCLVDSVNGWKWWLVKEIIQGADDYVAAVQMRTQGTSSQHLPHVYTLWLKWILPYCRCHRWQWLIFFPVTTCIHRK